MQIEWITDRDTKFQFRTQYYHSNKEIQFDLLSENQKADPKRERCFSNIPLDTARQVRDALDASIKAAEQGKPHVKEPLVKEADPELELLLAEEEEIERRSEFLKQEGLCSTLGDLRGHTDMFGDNCYLSEVVVVEPVMNAGRWKVRFKRISDG